MLHKESGDSVLCDQVSSKLTPWNIWQQNTHSMILSFPTRQAAAQTTDNWETHTLKNAASGFMKTTFVYIEPRYSRPLNKFQCILQIKMKTCGRRVEAEVQARKIEWRMMSDRLFQGYQLYHLLSLGKFSLGHPWSYLGYYRLQVTLSLKETVGHIRN